MIELLQFLYPQFQCTINYENVTILLILGRSSIDMSGTSLFFGPGLDEKKLLVTVPGPLYLSLVINQIIHDIRHRLTLFFPLTECAGLESTFIQYGQH